MDKLTENFIKKCKNKFGDKFDYNKVVYKGSHENVIIVCPKHGEFTVRATNFLTRGECPKCNQEVRQNGKLFNEFLTKAKSQYGDKYSYEKVIYKNCKEKIIVTCKEHGDFLISPDKFLQGQECPQCVKEKQRIFLENNFLNELKLIYKNEFDTSKVHYINEKTPIILICKKHGEFHVLPLTILNGFGCPKCKKDKINEKIEIKNIIRKNKAIDKKENIIKSFFEKSKEIHNNKYDYSKSEYKNATTKICIICPEHGEFWQSPNAHLAGKGCPKCCGKYKETKDFIKEAKEIHGDKYDYSKVVYNKSSEKVCIICHKKDKYGKEHGEFWQTPNKHLGGQGCPICKESHLERDIRNSLIEKSINFKQYERPKFLNGKEYDFFLPEYNIAIECQGSQHFNEKGWHNLSNIYNEIIKRDIEKYYDSIANNIKLLYFFPKEIKLAKIMKDKRFESIYNENNVYYLINELFNKIKSEIN